MARACSWSERRATARTAFWVPPSALSGLLRRGAAGDGMVRPHDKPRGSSPTGSRTCLSCIRHGARPGWTMPLCYATFVRLPACHASCEEMLAVPEGHSLSLGACAADRRCWIWAHADGQSVRDTSARGVAERPFLVAGVPSGDWLPRAETVLSCLLESAACPLAVGA